MTEHFCPQCGKVWPAAYIERRKLLIVFVTCKCNDAALQNQSTATPVILNLMAHLDENVERE